MTKKPDLPTLFTLPKPLQEESVSSWFARVRHEHRLSMRDLLRAFKLKNVSDIDTSTISGGLSPITNGTSFSPQRITKMTFVFLWLGVNTIKHFVLNRTSHRQAFVSFCPDCLREPIPYWRYSWRFRYYRICQTHLKPMPIACQYCGEKQLCNKTNFKISASDRKIALRYCCHCLADLSVVQKNKIHKPEIINKHILVQNFLHLYLQSLVTFKGITHKYICEDAEKHFLIYLKIREPNPHEFRLLRYTESL